MATRRKPARRADGTFAPKRGRKPAKRKSSASKTRRNSGVCTVRRRTTVLGKAPAAAPARPKFAVGQTVSVHGDTTGKILYVWPPGSRGKRAEAGYNYEVMLRGDHSPDTYPERVLSSLR